MKGERKSVRLRVRLDQICFLTFLACGLFRHAEHRCLYIGGVGATLRVKREHRGHVHCAWHQTVDSEARHWRGSVRSKLARLQVAHFEHKLLVQSTVEALGAADTHRRHGDVGDCAVVDLIGTTCWETNGQKNMNNSSTGGVCQPSLNLCSTSTLHVGKQLPIG